MSVNFFQPACQTETDDTLFGICDDENSSRAYTDTRLRDRWIAIVNNENGYRLTFTAIDNCIVIKKTDGNKERRCDGMLTYPGNIVFIELKNQRSDWIKLGVSQLSRTISLFKRSHPQVQIPHRRAFLANKRHPQFHHNHKDTMKRFKHETGVRLIIHNTIKV